MPIIFSSEYTREFCLQWLWDLQTEFEAWLDSMEIPLDVEDEAHLMNDGVAAVDAVQEEVVDAMAEGVAAVDDCAN
jgi:hypothetical protein